jgi:hypothetical protein
MAQETVFYFDVLGFRQKSKGQGEAAVDALTDLARLLGTAAIAHLTGDWAHRYALSDSVFLTHEDPATAVRQAAVLFFNIASLTLNDDAPLLVPEEPADDEPLLVRGALAEGEVRHLKGIFLESAGPANLVGQGVVDAVTLEQGSGLKGPRILIAEQLVRKLPSALADWLLRPTSAPGVWEVLWLLPPDPASFSGDEMYVKNICDRALRLLAKKGGDREHGVHYREFLLLAVRSIERMRRAVAAGTLPAPVISSYFDAAAVEAACEKTSGIPDEYAATLMRLVESVT